jgi:hypothetical protein
MVFTVLALGLIAKMGIGESAGYGILVSRAGALVYWAAQQSFKWWWAGCIALLVCWGGLPCGLPWLLRVQHNRQQKGKSSFLLVCRQQQFSAEGR